MPGGSHRISFQALQSFFFVRGQKATDPSQKKRYNALSTAFSTLSQMGEVIPSIHNRRLLKIYRRKASNGRRHTILCAVLAHMQALEGKDYYYYPLQDNRPTTAAEIMTREDNEHFRCFFRFTKDQFMELCQALVIPQRYTDRGYVHNYDDDDDVVLLSY